MRTTRSIRSTLGIYIGFMALALILTMTGLPTEAGARGSADKYKVDPSIVCMVNDNVMGKPQIPIIVEGKTYYGCCKNCVKTLNEDTAIRAAKDPYTGKTVDKSEAFIIEGPGGEALYFESDLTAGEFVDSFK